MVLGLLDCRSIRLRLLLRSTIDGAALVGEAKTMGERGCATAASGRERLPE